MSRKRINIVGKRALTRHWLYSIPKRKLRLDTLREYAKFKVVLNRFEINEKRKQFSLIADSLCFLGGRCYVCGKKSQHRHHVIPLYADGENTRDNVVPLCKRCHVKVHLGIERAIYIPVGFAPAQFNDLAEGRKRYSGPKKGCLSGFSGIVAA